MVTRQIQVRTPRKEKVWASDLLIDTMASSTRGVAGDMIGNWKSDVGVSATTRVTVMRIIGHVRLVFTGVASTSVAAKVRWGIAWVPSQVASASDGDAQIPRPGNATRQAEWLQRGVLIGEEETVSVPAGSTLRPIETSFLKLDITQQRKQPTVDHELVLIWDSLSTIESNTMSIEYEGHIMLALP